jgi:integration host factor subunit beta
MNKLELIQALKDATDLSKPEAAAVVDIFFNGMADELAKGGRVEIRGLCSFFVKEYDGYTGRNPKTGERVKIKPKKLPFFKAGKELKERVDQLASTSPIFSQERACIQMPPNLLVLSDMKYLV